MKKTLFVLVGIALLLSGCFGNPLVSAELVGSWSTAFEGQDGAPNMLFEFNEDGTFKWYQDESVTSDNYYYGNYTVVNGEAAIRAAEQATGNSNLETQLQDYGFAADFNDLFFVILQQQGVMMDGVETKYQTETQVPLILQLNGPKNELYGVNYNTFTRYFMTKI
ncbi:membrane lipoprotein lipid attachment site-containing protein [Culicoidibacter larvae]|uniref:Lipocalin-like domain-containing protein n=1 Tax=Culicoidibacter larvae TaxID=2579976 RepID=A0A5R8Q7U6_9FIRM|nr:membrane lipoprotein lipid attachment site-containing protein [Culicoidibacter larvae]TLG71543.1 hypothetical protein FEZ08_10645 [Culicoidibacter larvae]